MDLEHLFLRYGPVGIVSVAKGGKGWGQPCVEFWLFPALPAPLPFAPITALAGVSCVCKLTALL